MELTPFQHDHADAVVALWRRSFEHGTGLADPHPLHEQRHFLLTQIAPRCTVAVAWMPGGPADRVPAGFIAHTTGTVEQLYVDPPWMGQGIGTALLQRAQSAARAAGGRPRAAHPGPQHRGAGVLCAARLCGGGARLGRDVGGGGRPLPLAAPAVTGCGGPGAPPTA